MAEIQLSKNGNATLSSGDTSAWIRTKADSKEPAVNHVFESIVASIGTSVTFAIEGSNQEGTPVSATNLSGDVTNTVNGADMDIFGNVAVQQIRFNFKSEVGGPATIQVNYSGGA